MGGSRFGGWGSSVGTVQRGAKEANVRKLTILAAACALVAGLAVAPAASAKTPKVRADVTVDLPLPAPGSSSATATGNIKSLSSCRRNRNVRFEFVDSNGAVVPNAGGSGRSAGNGNFTVIVQYPTAPGTYTVYGIVDAVRRKFKGIKVRCTETRGNLGTVTAT
jgi:hypothetical protein